MQITRGKKSSCKKIKTTFGTKKILDHLFKKTFIYLNVGHLLLQSALNV